MKGIRGNYIAAKILESRPDYESYEEFCRRTNLPFSLTTENLNNRKDVTVGLLYRICKVFGYQIIVYNPKPPKGLNQMYVVGEKRDPVLPRELKGKAHIRKDDYTGEIYRAVRPYKKKKVKRKFIRVS